MRNTRRKSVPSRFFIAIGRLVVIALLAGGWLLPRPSGKPEALSDSGPGAGPAGKPAAFLDRAVLDRVEDGRLAVLLVGPSERERRVPLGELPGESRPGDWLIVHGDSPERLTYQPDPEGTAAAFERAFRKQLALKARGCAVTCP